VAQQPNRPFRRFLGTTLGRVLIILLAFAVTFATYAYVSVILAIPAILLFGLALPIWGGLKRPRILALIGLVIVLAVAPIATIVFTQEILTPIGESSSAAGAPFSNGGPLMQNASVTPYSGSTNTNFTWTVTVFPGNHPAGNSTPNEIVLYISTCPGATGNNSPNCNQPYPLTILTNKTLPSADTGSYKVRFHYRIGSEGIWAWQMAIYTNNSTTQKPFYQLLVGDPTYNGIEGPVVGSFSVIYLDLLPTIYFQAILFLGAPFYVILLVYMLLKNRERRRKEEQLRAPGPVPPSGGPVPGPSPSAGGTPLPSSQGPPSGPSGAIGGAAPAPEELNCPKCNAVVYPGEVTCWKCGTALPGSPSEQPK